MCSSYPLLFLLLIQPFNVRHIAVIPEGVRRTPGTVPVEPFGIGNDHFNAGLKQSKY